jgi:hypothetical protein
MIVGRISIEMVGTLQYIVILLKVERSEEVNSIARLRMCVRNFMA